MQFRCNFTNRPKFDVNHNSNELLVEKGTIMSLSERVRMITMQGYRLEMEALKALYDFSEIGENHDFAVPQARRPGYDLVDAHKELQEYKRRARQVMQNDLDERLAKQDKYNKAKLEAAIEKEVAARLSKKEKPAQ